MNKKILFLLAVLSLASATTITSKFHQKADFTEASLLGFYFPNTASTDKILLGNINGLNLVGPFSPKEKVVYAHPELVAPRKSLDGTVSIYGVNELSETDLRITIDGTPATILAIQQEGQGFLVTFQSTTFKRSRVSVEMQVNKLAWSFRGFILEAQVCGVYCQDCANNANICTACPKNSTLVNGKCICNAGYSATGIAPLTCELTDQNTMYPNLCYLEHILYLVNNEIRTRVVREGKDYFMIGTLAGFKMPTNSCYFANGKYMINIQTCFVHYTKEDDCSTFAAEWQEDGLSYQIKMTDEQLLAGSYYTTPKPASYSENGKEYDGTDYEFRVDVRFSSTFDWGLDCGDDEMCTAEYIREHRFKLRITKFVDTTLNNLVFITENQQTAEDCGCPFNEFIKGTAYIYNENTCQTINKNPVYQIGKFFYVGVEMDNHNMIGNINIEKLQLECFNKLKQAKYLSQTIVSPSWEFAWKTCATTQAIKLDRDSLCKECKSNLKVIISYYPEGQFDKKGFLSQAAESLADDVQQTTVEVGMNIVFPEDEE